MTSAPDVSVVIPTRNRAGLVERLLRQLLRADPELTYQIIVVDEASSDDTPAVLQRYADEYGIDVLRNDPPLKLPGARNAGFDASRGRYVAWIDDDDLTSPDRLLRQVRELDRTGRRWSCAARVDIDDDLRVIGHMRCPEEEGLLERLLAFNVLPTAAQGLVVRRDLALEVGGYDPELDSAEDWEYCIRLAAIELPVLVDYPLVGYRTGVASMSTDTVVMERAISKVLTDHGDLRRSLDVEPDWFSIHHSLLAADLGNGRLAALRRAVVVARFERRPRSFLRCGLVAVAPGWFARRSATQRAVQVPASWHRAARSWLDDVDLSSVSHG